VAVLCDLDACRRVAWENVEDARHEGLDHVELRFSPWFMSEPHGHDPAAVVEAVVDGVESAARATGMSVGLIGILSRTYGPETGRRELDALLAQARHLVALDLAGDEVAHPAPEFVEHFRRALDAGLAVTVHAGEADGARSIRDSIERLGATRIGHAVRAIDDPALMDLMAARGIGIEANLTSNVQTSTVPGYAAHPLRAFLERGLLATINTDDPSISGIDLRHEYEVAAPEAGLTPAHAHAAQANALAIAFLPEDARRTLAAGAAARARAG
jgi:adenosine deaminase